MKFIRYTISILFILIIAVYISASWVLSNRVLIPNSTSEKTLEKINIYWSDLYEEQKALLPKPSSFSVTSFDGLSLSGNYFNYSETAQCVIIMAHGWGVSWEDMIKYIPAISHCECNIVMYDHRAHGESEGKYGTGGIKEAKDLLTVTDWVQKTYQFTDQQTGWLGSSWGAAAALTAAATEKDVAFIIADAPFQDWYSAVFERAIRDYGNGIKLLAPGVMQMVNWRADVEYLNANVLKTARKIEEPVLLIHSEKDQATGYSQSVNISKELNSKSTFHLTQWGNMHVMDVVNNQNELKELINNFLMKERLFQYDSVR